MWAFGITWRPLFVVCHLLTFKYFLPSFGSFGHAVSEEEILKIGQSETRIACGGHVW
jgi:hypothetical protein